MIDPSAVDVSALTVLRLVVWANVGFAVAMLLGVVLWLASSWFEARPHGK